MRLFVIFFILKENQSLKISFIQMKSILKGLPSVDVEDEKKNVFNAALLLRVPVPPYEPAGVYIDHFSCS